MFLMAPLAPAQIIAGSAEDKMFQKVNAEENKDSKLRMLMEFEQEFPQSSVLTDIYLMMIDVYRLRNDREKIIEYGEKTLKRDQDNVTAMMVLSRNYAIKQQNLERAAELAQRAVEVVAGMKSKPRPEQYTDTQWNDYLRNAETAARTMLEYVRAVKGG
jgi:hypothetical protein